MSTDEQRLREAIFATAQSQLHVRERTNRNDHPQIVEYNRVLGLPKNAFYCASGLYWCYRQNGARVPIPGPGSVANWFRDPAKLVWKRGGRGNQRSGPKPQLMDAVSLYTSHVEGLAQTTWDPDADRIRTIGFNTTGGTGRGGVYLVTRRFDRDRIKAVANHLTPYLKAQREAVNKTVEETQKSLKDTR